MDDKLVIYNSFQMVQSICCLIDDSIQLSKAHPNHLLQQLHHFSLLLIGETNSQAKTKTKKYMKTTLKFFNLHFYCFKITYQIRTYVN